MAAQFPLGFTSSSASSREDFFVSDANKEVFHLIEKWPGWPSHILIITGPTACGKTHLAKIWQEKSKAIFTEPEKDWKTYQQKNLIIDDYEVFKEETILHLFNSAKESGNFILLTGENDVSKNTFSIPDLASRLKSAITVRISPPDDELINALLIKQFRDKQLSVDAEVIAYVVKRLERSFVAIKEFVNKTDELSLSEQRNVTIPLVKRIVG